MTQACRMECSTCRGNDKGSLGSPSVVECVVRVREAHRESVRAAVRELERCTQAGIGNVHSPATTGNCASEQDSS